MKKICSIILTTIILALSFSVCSFAQDPVLLSIQDEKVYAGDEFNVNVFISDNSQLSGAVMDINYDKNYLEFVSAKEGAILDPKANISIRNVNNSSVKFAYMSSSSLDTGGILFTITFKALESAKGDTDLKITIPNAADFVDSDLEKIEYTVENSNISILNNISIDTTEPSTEESTSDSEIISQESQNEDITEPNTDSNDNNNKEILFVLLLLGAAIICFVVVLAIKKRK